MTNKTKLYIINKIKLILKKEKIIHEMFNEKNININILDFIPIRFGDIDVSAKTNHGIIILNNKFINQDIINILPYCIHELEHYLFQSYKGKSQGADDGEYLDNPREIDAFQFQLQFLDDQFGPQEANKYVDHLLDHHEIEDPKERSEKKQELMEKVDK